MVCMTHRWRGMDSNFQYAEAVKLVVAPFLASVAWDGLACCGSALFFIAESHSTEPGSCDSQGSARRDTVEIAVEIDLQQRRRMVSRATGRLGDNTSKPSVARSSSSHWRH